MPFSPFDLKKDGAGGVHMGFSSSLIRPVRPCECRRQLAATGEQLEQARSAEREATIAAGTRAAATEARATALQEAHDALLQRVTPEAAREMPDEREPGA